jgi:hypothetical protein
MCAVIVVLSLMSLTLVRSFSLLLLVNKEAIELGVGKSLKLMGSFNRM